MPEWSGLYNGKYGGGYAAEPKAPEVDPKALGPVRDMMQREGMFGVVDGVGQNVPATRTAVDAVHGNLTAPGTVSWPSRTQVRDVNIPKAEANSANGNQTVNETIDATPIADAAARAEIFNTVLNNEYVADKSGLGTTAMALAETVAV